MTSPESGQDYRPGPSLEDASGGIDPTTVDAIQAAQDRVEAKQRGTLEGGLAFRDGGGLPTTYPGGVPHEQLYAWSQEPDPAALDEDGQGWNDDGNTVQELATRLGTLAGSSESGWEGASGDACRAALNGLSGGATTTSQGAQFMATTLRQESASAATLRTMPEPVPYDEAGYLDRMRNTTDPAEMFSIAAERSEQQQRHLAAYQEAQRLTTQYTDQVRTAEPALVAFDPPAPIDGGSAGGPGGSAYPSGGPGPGSAGGYPSGRSDVGSGWSPAPVGSAGYAPPAITAPTPGQTAPGAPGTGGGPGFGGPGGGSPGGGPVPGFVPGGSGPSGARPGTSAPGRGPGSVISGRGGSAGGGAGSGGGSRGFGPAGGSGGGSGNSGGGFGPGGRTGAMPSAPGAPGTSPGAAGRAGAPGAGGAPMGGAGGKGRHDDDYEHERPSWLVETRDVWEDGLHVLPAVIGETDDEIAAREAREQGGNPT